MSKQQQQQQQFQNGQRSSPQQHSRDPSNSKKKPERSYSETSLVDCNSQSSNNATANDAGSSAQAWSCVVCCQNVPGPSRKEFYAIGPCEHPVCYECSTKMRLLCEQNECPICRQEILKVVFTPNRHLKYSEIDFSKITLFDENNLIYFENEAAEKAYRTLLEHRCKVCKSKDLKTMKDLDIHLRREHELHLCELCVENLKVFSHERKYYSRKELIQHRKYGDYNDTSHRGHPDCKFCDVRYMDDEDLHRHLRKDHYHCHICDPMGLNQFYDSYINLREHYRSEHFLCEEGPCREERFTSVFRSEIDLQAHRMLMHCVTKTEAREARILNLDFSLKPRGAAFAPQLSASIHHNPYRSKPGQSKEDKAKPEDMDYPDLKQTSQEVPRMEDFPSLSGGASHSGNEMKSKTESSYATSAEKSKELPQKANTKPKGKGKPNSSTFCARAGGSIYRNDDEFPALGGGSPFFPPSADPSILRKELKNYCSLSSVAAAVTSTVPKVVSKITTVPCLPSTSTCINNGNNSNSAKSISTQSLISSSSGGTYNMALEEFPALEPAPGKKRMKNRTVNKENGTNINKSGNQNNTQVQSKNSSSSSKNQPKSDFAAKLKANGQQAKEAKVQPINVGTSSNNSSGKNKNKGKQKSSKAESNVGSRQQQTSSKSSAKENSPAVKATVTESSFGATSDDSKVVLKEKEFPDLESVSRILNVATNNPAVKSVVFPEKDASWNASGSSVQVDSTKTKPPPGFTSMTSSSSRGNLNASNPPPGFEKNSKRGAPPPPLINLEKEMTLSSVAQVIVSDNNLSSLNSSRNLSKDENGNSNSEDVLVPASKSNTSGSASSTGSRCNNSNANHGSPSKEVTCNTSASEQPGSNGLRTGGGSMTCKVADAYVSPNNFEERNLTLGEEVVDLLHRDQQKFGAFKKISDEFRRGEMRAEDYYKKCLELFDSRTSFHKIFLELIALLPNVKKQNELLAAHEKNMKLTRGAIPKRTRASDHHSSSGVWIVRAGTSIDDGLLVCPKCQQVLAKKDGPEHMSSHS